MEVLEVLLNMLPVPLLLFQLCFALFALKEQGERLCISPRF